MLLVLIGQVNLLSIRLDSANSVLYIIYRANELPESGSECAAFFTLKEFDLMEMFAMDILTDIFRLDRSLLVATLFLIFWNRTAP